MTQPVTFAELKKRWRKRAQKYAEQQGEHEDFNFFDGKRHVFVLCSQDLESLEQRVRALRDSYIETAQICDDHGPGHEGNCRCYKMALVLVGELTVLLGEPERRA